MAVEVGGGKVVFSAEWDGEKVKSGVETSVNEVKKAADKVVAETAKASEKAGEEVTKATDKVVAETAKASEKAGEEVTKATAKTKKAAADAGAKVTEEVTKAGAKVAGETAKATAKITQETEKAAGKAKKAADDAGKSVTEEVKGVSDDVKTETAKIGKNTEKAGKQAKKSFKGFGNNVAREANQAAKASEVAGKRMAKAFAIGSIIAGAIKKASQLIFNFGLDCIKAAETSENAFRGLSSVIRYSGRSMSEAQKFLEDYTNDGLVSMTEATMSYKNLLARGYDTKQIEHLMIRLKDSSTYGRQSALAHGEAIVTATEGLKNENSVLVDNAGVTKNVAKMWEEYAASIGTTANKLTDAQKRQAEYNGIMKETAAVAGDAARSLGSFSGRMSKLNATINKIKTNIGSAFINILNQILPYVQLILNAIEAATAAFARFIAFITGADITIETSTFDGLSGAIGGAADSASDLGDTTEDSMKDADKAAQKLKKSLLGFDAINKLSAPDTGSSSDKGTGATGGLGEIGTVSNDIIGSTIGGAQLPELDFGQWQGAVDNISSAIRGVMELIRELAGMTMKAFKLTFSSEGLQNLLDKIKSLIDWIGKLWTSIKPDFVTMLGRIATNLGIIVGALANIAVNIATNITGGIAKWIERDFSYIENTLKRTMTAIGDTSDKLADFALALENISGLLTEDDFIEFTSLVIGIGANIALGLVAAVAEIFDGIVDIITKPIIDNQEKIKEALRIIIKPMNEVLDELNEAIKTFFSDMSPITDPLHELAENLSELFGNVLDNFNKLAPPYLDRIGKKWQELISKFILPAAEKLKELVGKIIKLISRLIKAFAGINEGESGEMIMELNLQGFEAANAILVTLLETGAALVELFEVTLGGALDFVANLISGEFGEAFQSLQKIGTDVLDVFIRLVDAIFPCFDLSTYSGEQFAEDIHNDLIKPITDFGDKVGEFFGKITEGAGNLLLTPLKSLKDFGAGLFDIGTKSDGANKKFGLFTSDVTSKSGTAGTSFGDLKDKIVKGAAEIGTTAKEDFNKFVTEGLEGIGSFATDGIEDFNTFVTDTTQKVVDWKDDVLSKFDDLWTDILKWGAEFITGVVKFFSDTKTDVITEIGKWLTDWVEKVVGVKDDILTKFSEMKDGAIKQFDDAKEGIEKVVDNIKTALWKKWGSIVTDIKDIFSKMPEKFGQWFSDAYTALTGAFSGVQEFFQGIFDGVVNIFSGIGESVGNAVSGVKNFFTGGSNTPTTNPSGVSGGVNIPKLATGGYVKANSPTLAMIGDNKNAGEIVAPEYKIAEAVAAGIQASQGGNNGQQQQGDLYIPIYLDGRVISEYNLKGSQIQDLRSGGR